MTVELPIFACCPFVPGGWPLRYCTIVRRFSWSAETEKCLVKIRGELTVFKMYEMQPYRLFNRWVLVDTPKDDIC